MQFRRKAGTEQWQDRCRPLVPGAIEQESSGDSGRHAIPPSHGSRTQVYKTWHRLCIHVWSLKPLPSAVPVPDVRKYATAARAGCRPSAADEDRSDPNCARVLARFYWMRLQMRIVCRTFDCRCHNASRARLIPLPLALRFCCLPGFVFYYDFFSHSLFPAHLRRPRGRGDSVVAPNGYNSGIFRRGTLASPCAHTFRESGRSSVPDAATGAPSRARSSLSVGSVVVPARPVQHTAAFSLRFIFIFVACFAFQLREFSSSRCRRATIGDHGVKIPPACRPVVRFFRCVPLWRDAEPVIGIQLPNRYGAHQR